MMMAALYDRIQQVKSSTKQRYLLLRLRTSNQSKQTCKLVDSFVLIAHPTFTTVRLILSNGVTNVHINAACDCSNVEQEEQSSQLFESVAAKRSFQGNNNDSVEMIHQLPFLTHQHHLRLDARGNTPYAVFTLRILRARPSAMVSSSLETGSSRVTTTTTMG
jgi:hypothetical protein